MRGGSGTAVSADPLGTARARSSRRWFTARVLPGLNHLFVEDADGFPQNYARLPKPVTMQAQAVDDISEWLAERLR